MQGANLMGAHAVHVLEEDLAQLGPCTSCVNMQYLRAEDVIVCALHECQTKADCTCLAWEGRDGTKPQLSRYARGIIKEGKTLIQRMPRKERGG
jgi:hypothetical protein